MKTPKKKEIPLPASLVSPRCRCKSQLCERDEDDRTVLWCLRCGRKKKAA